MASAAISVDSSSPVDARDEYNKNDDDVFSVPIICDNLPLYPNKKIIYTVTLHTKYISWEQTESEKGSAKVKSLKARRESLKSRRSSSIQSVSEDSSSSEARQTIVSKGGLFINMADVVGCDCMKGRTADDTSAYVTLYAYPHKKKMASKRTIRKRETLTLIFKNCDTFEENLKEAQKWKNAIQCLARRMDISQVKDLARMQINISKKMMVLINPFGGQGKALKLFQQRVAPVLSEASIPYEVVVTEYAGHAREMMSKLDTNAWYGLLIVSGDGLIHEAVNGLMHRPDWEDAMKIPIGVLPGGSGNALCCSISYQAGEPFLDNHVMHASFAIAKHTVLPMDLVAIDTCQGERLYSFLMAAWGIMADVDIESEKYRSLGTARFTVGTIVRIMGLRKYKGKVSFLPVEEYKGPSSKKKPMERSVSENAPEASHSNQPVRSVSMMEGPVSGPAPVSRGTSQTNGAGDSIENIPVGVDGLQKVPSGDQETMTNGNNHPAKTNHDNGDAQHSKIETPLLAPLDQPVPSDWVTIEDSFVNVAVIYKSHLAKDMLAGPDCELAKDFLYLNIIKGNINRVRLLQAFTAMQEGKHLLSDVIEVIKVKAFRIEPEEKEGTITCDGELIAYGPVQGQILSTRANIMALKK